MKLPKGYLYVRPGTKLQPGDLMPNGIRKPSDFIPVPSAWVGDKVSLYWYFIRKISGNSAGLKK